ncbi:MAG: glycosyltransferase family 4 protein [Candidatus Parvarchaeota archaeon]|nr:glycosyltransferase family 4 protein [Candidatus Jingweiarchaeum tengchongense]MCW1310752.1 glycosyltransferase family 4 protein [Candidatus Jingweiarchaeum tengchongense]
MKYPKLFIIGPTKTKKFFSGGVTQLVTEECRELNKFGIKFELLNLETFYGNFNLTSRFKFFLKVSKKILKEKPKIALIHGPFYLLITYPFLKLVNTKIIAQMHGIPQPKIEPTLKLKLIAYLQMFIWHLLIRRCDCIITISNANKKEAIRLFGRANYKVIYNGIRIKKIKFFKRKNRRVKLLFLARIHPYKGIYEVIDAARDIDADFIIAGGGPILEEIKEKTKEMKNIKVLGEVSDKKKNYLLKQANIFIMPSHHEWFGISFLEAMQYYLPIISTKSGAIPEIIENNKSGILVPIGSVTSLKKAIFKLIKNEKLREKMGKIGRKILEDKFDIRITTGKLVELLEQFNEL